MKSLLQLCFTLCLFLAGTAHSAPPPNVLFIAVDDLNDVPPAAQRFGRNCCFAHIRQHQHGKQGIQCCLAHPRSRLVGLFIEGRPPHDAP